MTEVKLDFVTKSSLANLNYFWLRLLHNSTTISKYGRTNNIKISWSKNIWLSASLKFLC